MRQILFLAILCFCFSSLRAQNALHFDGVDDYVDLGNHYGFDRESTFSVEAWVRVAPGNGVVQIISKTDQNVRGWGIQVMESNHFHSGTVLVFLSDVWPSDVVSRFGDTNIRDNQWHHLAVTYDGSSTMAGIRIFLDGVEEVYHDSADNLNQSIANSAPCLLGAWDNGGMPTEFLEGSLDHVKIWRVVRTPAEIASPANQQREICTPPDGSLVGMYNFNAGVPGGNNMMLPPVVPDLALVPNHGTMVNFAQNGPTSNWVGPQPTRFCLAKTTERNGIVEVEIWPSPGNGLFQVRLPKKQGQTADFLVYDVQGNLVYQREGLPGWEHEIDLRELHPGSYVLHLTNAGEQSVHKLLIVE